MRVFLLIVFTLSYPCVLQAAGGAFEAEVDIVSGLGVEADERMAEQLEEEIASLVYLTAAQRRTLDKRPPGHVFRVEYIGETRVGALQVKPGSRPDIAPTYHLDFATTGALSCELFAREGEELISLQSWSGSYLDEHTLSMGRSAQHIAHVREIARQMVMARLVTEIGAVVKESAAARWWPAELKELEPDERGNVKGIYTLTNQSPWGLDFTPQVVGEVVNPEKQKTTWYYMYYFPPLTLPRQFLRPGEQIERPFVLGLKSPTPEQIATGRVYQTEPDDFAFYPAMRRVAWNSKLSPDAQRVEDEAEAVEGGKE